MKKSIVLFVLVFIFILGFIIWRRNGTLPVNAKSKEEKLFVIPRGSTVREIGNHLKNEGLIRDPVIFFLYVKQKGIDKSIQAGDYKLSPSMSLSQVMHTLEHGTLDVWFTIPEGYRADEVADLLKQSVKTYKEDWRKELNANEGYLFPDTYLIPTDTDVATVISIMKNNFDKKVGEVGLDPNSPSIKNVVTLASLIEREAITDAEKPVIAGVLSNRLSVGMLLQVDATIQYAKGYSLSKKKWWAPVTIDEYKSVKSPYNTYLYIGLPPGPISNPGIKAIEAAANPSETDYNYYIHDSSGKIRYAKSLDEHNSNIERYLR